MQDFPDRTFFVFKGREHVEANLKRFDDKSMLFAIIPMFRDGLSLEQNIINMFAAYRLDEQKGKQFAVPYCPGDRLYCQEQALIYKVALPKHKHLFEAYIKEVRSQFGELPYVFHDGQTFLIQGETKKLLPTFEWTLDSLDRLASEIFPGFRTEGNYNNSMTEVRLRSHQASKS